MKKLLLILLFLPALAFANPEIGRQIHFVMDQNNADNEAKFSADQCQAGVYPDGNGSAQGYALCVKFQPNEPFPENTNTKELSFDTTGFECELFDYSNNAGADVGYNVTQYNSQNWTAKYHKQQVTGGWRVKYYEHCQDGAQQ